MIGEVIDHYRVLELIGRGAMGVVYKALDINLDRQVAIKVMSAEVRSTPDFVERFRQEARLQGALNHPNVALLFDYFIHDAAPIAVMEYIQGESLEELIHRRGPIPAHEAIPIFKQALRGVAAAHRAGIIHRDLKPTNLMITKDDVVKVMDFGIAKRQGTTGATKASTSIGSPLYMAPEQILGRTVDCRTDVYALGITLYELLSGQPPFNPRGKAEFVVLNSHVNDLPDPPTVYHRDIPQPLVDAVMRALAKEPEARFQNIEEFMGALPEVPVPRAPTPRLGPTGTVAFHTAAGNAGAVRVGPTGTMVLEPIAPASRTDPSATVWFEPSGPVGSPTPAAAAMAAPSGDNRATSPSVVPPVAQRSVVAPGRLERPRLGHPMVLTLLTSMLVLGAVVRHTHRLRATRPDAARALSGAQFMPAQSLMAAPAPISSEPTARSPALNSPHEVAAPTSADVSPATIVPPDATAPSVTTSVPVGRELSGTWRGDYVDASGKPLLRVVSLSIRRVHEDGGIEGTLEYEAAAGAGECMLRPRGSTYSAGEQRLQLSPEGCSPHYPKELSVPLDFDGVDPRTNLLTGGRIEAPTNEAIRVELKRVSGA